MLTGPDLKAWEQLVRKATRGELTWMSDYISHLIKPEASAAIVANTIPVKITILYGTETGNSKRVATELSGRARKNNLAVKIASLDQYRLNDLAKEENLFIVISTQGDGEPPAAAQKFYDHIHLNGFRLNKVRYSVLALGDTSYPLFCKTGEDVDEQLQKLGGNRIVPIRKCDLDYDTDVDEWFAQVLLSLGDAPAAAPVSSKPAVESTVKSNKILYTATVLANTNLNDHGSSKETYHLELAAGDVDFLPGDSIGVVPENTPQLVQAVLGLAKVNGENRIQYKDAEYTVAGLVARKLNLVYLPERIVKKYAEIVGETITENRMDLVELLQLYPLKDAAQFEEVLHILPVQSPRIYTIASSKAAHNGEVHLTVEKYRFSANGKKKTGVCSEYLSRLAENDNFEFFVQKNKRFRLPAADKDILMIGPGTGIAAFRSFLAERDITGATGRNWLFFGEEHFVSDFLYQTEIQDWASTGVLTGTSLAFSKDEPAGIYVWHKLIEKGREVYDWIRSGAHLYVCGEKTPMSSEVEKALLQVIETYSGLSPDATMAYFEQMKLEGRYSKDVY